MTPINKTDKLLLGALCIIIVALITMSVYAELPELHTPLEKFITEDNTDDHIYDLDNYHCVHFSIALTQNLTSSGFSATPVLLETYRPEALSSHMVVSVTLDNGTTIFIDPQTDRMFSPDEWDDEIALGDTIQIYTLSQAKSMIN